MAIQMSPYNLGLASFVLFAVVVLAYRALLPKPIPGIPYKKESAKRILGDATDVSCHYDTRTELVEANEVYSF